MKIDSKHDYKKPLYAISLTTLIGATMLLGTACGPSIQGGMTVVEETQNETTSTDAAVDEAPAESEAD